MTETAETIYDQRLAAVERQMAADGLDALVVGDGFDVAYLTGFTGGDGVAVLVLTPGADDTNFFVTDRRYVTQMAKECPAYEVRDWYKGVPGYYGTAGQVVAQLATAGATQASATTARVGYYPDTLSHANFLQLTAQAPDVEWVAATPYIKHMRAHKTPEEIATIREACRISMLSFYALLDHIRPGVTEKDVDNALEREFRAHGGSGYCFTTIVASGPENGACPHATVTDRVLQKGDFVTIDFGAGYKGYCSDITRTVSLGPARPELRHMFDVVTEAKRAGHEALRAGTTPHAVHDAINAVITGAGYETPHGFGHSFGLAIHEWPFISPSDDTPYEAGTITTIEPGLYVPGVGGVRQEDDYLITADGSERLTFITDELIEL